MKLIKDIPPPNPSFQKAITIPITANTQGINNGVCPPLIIDIIGSNHDAPFFIDAQYSGIAKIKINAKIIAE